MIFHAFLIKYAEIAIKGKNRYIFEDALVKQMNIALSKVEGEFEVKKEQGRIYVFCPEQYDYDETVEALQHVFGIVGICPVVIYEDQGFEQMAKDVVSYMKNCHPNYDGSFKVYTRRAKKSYPITSMEVSAELGGRILDEFPDASVDVHEPDLTLSVEIRDKIYVYSQTIKGAGNAGYHLNVSDGGVLTLAGAAGEGGNPAQASYQGITVNGGTLNIGSADDPKTQLTLGSDGLSVTGDSTVAITTSSTTVDGLGNPFVTSSGNITLGDGTGEVTLVMNNLDTLVSGSSETLNMELFKTTDGALVSLGDNVTLQDMILGSMYENLELTTNDSMTAIILTGTARTENIFRDSSLTRNAATGADILWNSRYHMEEGTALRDFYTSVLLSQNSGDYSGAARKLAAAAGSTVTSLGIAQRDSLRDQMGWIRNRVAQMGVNPAYVHEDMPYFHMWMQGTGSYAKLDTRGDESGYELTTWGGTVGMDVDINDRFTAGAAFTANYASLTASAADTADGDLDSYYVNLFARYQYRKWSHLLILTGGWNDASLTRTVDYGTGSYQARGNTTGSGFGAMYELAYDIALNEDRSVILQPLFNASIVTTRMDGYRESGSAGNAGLKVEDQELTTAAVAVGARLSGLMGSNVFGREALGEVRVNVSQDMGDRRGQANVGFLADPSYTRPVYGAKVGSTAFQIGAGLSVPVGTQGVIFVDGNADIRSGSSSINGSIGYRYNF